MLGRITKWFRRSMRPRHSGVVVTLYTRVGCHLCDDARDVLLAHGCEPTVIDIDSDPALAEKYDLCVPVVEMDGKVRFRGQVNPILLRRVLDRFEAA